MNLYCESFYNGKNTQKQLHCLFVYHVFVALYYIFKYNCTYYHLVIENKTVKIVTIVGDK
jgi:hypothetical protein